MVAWIQAAWMRQERRAERVKPIQRARRWGKRMDVRAVRRVPRME